MDAVISLCEVTRRYDGGGRPAVDRVSLEVGPGEAVAVMGPSGSGKSTLLNLIAGLDRPTSGTVIVAGQRIDTLSETRVARFRSRQIGMIFQFFNLLDDLTVADNVLLPAQLAGMGGAAARARAGELLAALRISQHRDAYPARLSGGERQRVAIARALVNRPALLLADEPTGAVDTATGEEIGELLLDLNASGQLVATTRLPQVTAAAGPYAEATILTTWKEPNGYLFQAPPMTAAGRATPGGPRRAGRSTMSPCTRGTGRGGPVRSCWTARGTAVTSPSARCSR